MSKYGRVFYLILFSTYQVFLILVNYIINNNQVIGITNGIFGPLEYENIA